MLRTLAVSLTLLAAACSPPAQETKSDAAANRGESAASAVAGPIGGAGAVTAIDAAAGTVSIDHEPIAAIGWPSMTMQFTAADPAMLQGIAVGDRVTFELKSATESSTITMLRKQ